MESTKITKIGMMIAAIPIANVQSLFLKDRLHLVKMKSAAAACRIDSDLLLRANFLALLASCSRHATYRFVAS